MRLLYSVHKTLVKKQEHDKTCIVYAIIVLIHVAKCGFAYWENGVFLINNYLITWRPICDNEADF